MAKLWPLILDKISGQLVIVLFCKAQTRASEGSFGKKAMKIKVQVPGTPSFTKYF